MTSVSKLHARAKEHVALGWSAKRSARELGLPPITISRWRARWARQEEVRKNGRPVGSYRGRQLRASEKGYPKLRAEAAAIIDAMALPERDRELVRHLAGHGRASKLVLAHAEKTGFDLAKTRRLLDLLVTARNPWNVSKARPDATSRKKDILDRSTFALALDSKPKAGARKK